MNIHYILLIAPIIAFSIFIYSIYEILLPILQQMQEELIYLKTTQENKIHEAQHLSRNLYQTLNHLKKIYASHILLQQSEFIMRKTQLAKKKLFLETQNAILIKKQESYANHQEKMQSTLSLLKQALQIS